MVILKRLFKNDVNFEEKGGQHFSCVYLMSFIRSLGSFDFNL